MSAAAEQVTAAIQPHEVVLGGFALHHLEGENPSGRQLAGVEQSYTRAVMNKTDSSGANRITSVMHLEDMPPELQAQVNLPQTRDGSTILKHLSRLEFSAFTNFCKWNREQLAKEQASFEQQLPEYYNHFEERVAAAVNDGSLPAIAAQKVHKIREGKVLLDDGFSTIAHDRDGFNRNGTAVIFRKIDTHTLYHELGHDLAGTDEETGVQDKSHTGLYRIFGDGEGGKQLDEATTEYVAGVITNNHKNTTEHRKNVHTYEKGTTLLHTLCTKGVKKIDPQLFIGAQMEDAADKAAAGEHSYEAKLRRALQEAFPKEDVAALLSDTNFRERNMETISKQLARQHQARRIGALMLGRHRTIRS